MTTREDSYLAHGDARLSAIDKALKGIMEHVQHIPEMREQIAETRDIVEAWSTAKNVGRFIKWAGGILAALAAMWIAVKSAAAGLWQ